MAQAVEDALVVRMEASLRKFERQMEAGRKAAVKSATGSEQAWSTAGNQIAANSNRAATGIGRLTQISGRGRFVIQNTANQIGDMAVQIQGGTSASRAMGQQLPQLFGGFGALGGALGVVGPLMGTVAALGIPVAAAFLTVGEKAETLNEKLKAVEKTLAALQSAQQLSALSAADLVSQYGGLADEAQAVFEINRQIAAIKAQGALDSAARGIASELGVVGVFGFGPDEIRELEATISSLKKERDQLNAVPAGNLADSELAAANREIVQLTESVSQLEKVQKNVDNLAENLGLTDEAAREVVAQFAAIGQAQGPRAQAEAMSNLADYIIGASNNLADAEDEGKALYDQLLTATTQALELAKVDVASNIASGADEAERLKNELAAALELQNRVNAQDSKVYSGRGGDPRQVGNDNYTRDLNYESVDEIIAKHNKKSRSGAGADKGLREAQKLFDGTRTEAERYARELERIEELHRRFPQVVTSEVKDRAVAALNESMTLAGRMTDRLEQGFEDAFVSFVSGAGSASDAVRALAADLARMLAQSAFKSLAGNLLGDTLGGIFGGVGGPVIMNANGNAFEGGRVTPFANGGVVSSPTYFPMAGRNTGKMGEAGPEAIMPLARINGKLGVRTGGGASGGMVQVLVTMDASGNLVPLIQSVSGNVSAQTAATAMQMQDRKTSSNLQDHLNRKG